MRQWPLNTLAQQLYPRGDLVGRYIRWVLLFTRYRFELAEELDQLHGRSAQQPRIALMTPAMVDFGKWLEDDEHIQIEQQVEIMNRIARRRSGPRVHGFVAFDPLRQALYDHGRHKPSEKDPMVIVRNAIEVTWTRGRRGRTTGGAIGVKLYPPMGFQAIGNAPRRPSRIHRSVLSALGRHRAWPPRRRQARCGAVEALRLVRRTQRAGHGACQRQLRAEPRIREAGASEVLAAGARAERLPKAAHQHGALRPFQRGGAARASGRARSRTAGSGRSARSCRTIATPMPMPTSAR